MLTLRGTTIRPFSPSGRLFCCVLLLLMMSSPGILRADQEKTSKDSTTKEVLHFATFAGTAVHYESYGTGREALVFIHPWGGDVSFWRFQVPAFEGKTRVILIDLPGHGRSDKPLIAYTQELFASSVRAVLREAGVHQAVLVGNSMGGLVARQFYRMYPKMTKALVIVDMPLRPFDPKEFLEKVVAPMRGPDYKEHVRQTFGILFTPQTPSSLREEILTKILNTPQNVLVSSQEQMADPKIWRQDPISVPVLGIYSKTPYIPADNERFMRSLITNLDYQAWDGVGHFIMLEVPERFNEALTAFLVKNKFLKN
ncbi:MAG: alpha/beta hydrolase [Acidobacteriia bacterium]|nr:alpha/beta hydrolase [Terriglobia bacterium]